jgi:hypothetical protein
MGIKKWLLAAVLLAALACGSVYAPAAGAWRMAWFEGFDHVPTGSLTSTCPASVSGCMGPHMHAVAGSASDGHGQQRALRNAWTNKGLLHVTATPAWPSDGPAPVTGSLVVENGDGHGVAAWEVRARYSGDPTNQIWFNALLWRGPKARCWPVGGETNFAEYGAGMLHYFIHAARYPSDLAGSCGVQNSIRWMVPVMWPASSGGGVVDGRAWHVYRVERMLSGGVPQLVFKVDSRTTWTVRDSRIPMDSQILSLQVDYYSQGVPLVGQPEAVFDWARVWVP